MADLPNDFWSGWIIVLTTISLLTLGWMVISIYFFTGKDDSAHGSNEEPVWDENLREGSIAPPLWWFWLILGAMVFSVIYLMLYPGMGSYKGILQWSQDSRLENSYDNYDQQFDLERKAIVLRPISELQNDDRLMGSAKNIFARNCAACHGPKARGQASLFPDLRDKDWQWGGTAEQVEYTIRNGRLANMVSWQGVLGDEGVMQLAQYVMSMSTNSTEQFPGKQSYSQLCVACHGVDGKGNQQLGAPNLTDDIWLYGGSIKQVKYSISKGRNGVMPAFNERLDDMQIRLLVAWLTQ
jgi:cytochrome c oxidase cbb3-type subunit 3